jgi:hypothetical protein
MPKNKFKNSVTSLSRLTGQKYPGLVMLIMVTLDGMPPVRKIPSLQHENHYWLNFYGGPFFSMFVLTRLIKHQRRLMNWSTKCCDTLECTGPLLVHKEKKGPPVD